MRWLFYPLLTLCVAFGVCAGVLLWAGVPCFVWVAALACCALSGAAAWLAWGEDEPWF